MSKPMIHARSTARKYGGLPEDYLNIHAWFDQTKAHVADVRHRAILHSSFGVFLLEQQFGTEITNSAGRQVSVRDIGEQHVLEDLGFIPSIGQWLQEMPVQPWMAGRRGADRPREAEARGPLPTAAEIGAILSVHVLHMRKQDVPRDRAIAHLAEEIRGLCTRTAPQPAESEPEPPRAAPAERELADKIEGAAAEAGLFSTKEWRAILAAHLASRLVSPNAAAPMPTEEQVTAVVDRVANGTHHNLLDTECRAVARAIIPLFEAVAVPMPTLPTVRQVADVINNVANHTGYGLTRLGCEGIAKSIITLFAPGGNETKATP